MDYFILLALWAKEHRDKLKIRLFFVLNLPVIWVYSQPLFLLPPFLPLSSPLSHFLPSYPPPSFSSHSLPFLPRSISSKAVGSSSECSRVWKQIVYQCLLRSILFNFIFKLLYAVCWSHTLLSSSGNNLLVSCPYLSQILWFKGNEKTVVLMFVGAPGISGV